MQAFESGVLDLPHFYFTGGDYRFRFDVEAKTRFLRTLRERFNSGVNYKGRKLKWDSVIEQKMNELGRFLIGKSTRLDFEEPSPKLGRVDNREVRKRILAMTGREANELGIRKNTLHYLRHKARTSPAFEIYEPVESKLRAFA